MTSGRRLVAAIAVVLGLAVAGEACAGPASDQLRGQIDRVLKVLDDPDLHKQGKSRERRLAIRKIGEEIIDVAEMARRSMGRHWQDRTPAEKEEIVRLFGDLLDRSYISRVDTYNGEKVVVLGDVIDGDQATVKSKIIMRNGTEVPLDYRMLRRGDRWFAYDIAIEGVSLVANYRSQFNKIIVSGSYQDLVRKLQKKHDEQQADDSQKRTSLK